MDIKLDTAAQVFFLSPYLLSDNSAERPLPLLASSQNAFFVPSWLYSRNPNLLKHTDYFNAPFAPLLDLKIINKHIPASHSTKFIQTFVRKNRKLVKLNSLAFFEVIATAQCTFWHMNVVGKPLSLQLSTALLNQHGGYQ